MIYAVGAVAVVFGGVAVILIRIVIRREARIVHLKGVASSCEDAAHKATGEAGVLRCELGEQAKDLAREKAVAAAFGKGRDAWFRKYQDLRNAMRLVLQESEGADVDVPPAGQEIPCQQPGPGLE